MYVLSENVKTIFFFFNEIFIFSFEKNLCTLHGQVFLFEIFKTCKRPSFCEYISENLKILSSQRAKI